MGSKLLRVYILGGLSLLVVVAAGAFYYAFESVLPDTPSVPAPTATPVVSPIPQPEVPKLPEFNIRTKDKHTIIVEWHYLPLSTTRIYLFRGKNAKVALAFWKLFSITRSDLESGSREFTLSGGENPASYFYSVAAFGINGDPLWTSSSTPPISTPLPPIPPPNPIIITPPVAPTSTPLNPPPMSTSTPTSTPPIISTSTPTSTEPIPSPTSTFPAPTSSNPFSYPPGAILFYSPSGQITGYIVPVDYNFWAQYVDNKIELNWQSMPAQTDALYVYRSSTNSGPWIELLVQYNPPTNVPGSIKIIDETVASPFYYRMEARQGAQVLGNYGPVFLPGLPQ